MPSALWPSVLCRFTVVFGVGVLLLPSVAKAADPRGPISPQGSTARPQARIVNRIDSARTVTVAHTTPGRIGGLRETGRLAANTPMQHLMLVMRSSDEQEYALQTLLDQQQDRTHANFHQWLTPESFGAAFGVAGADIAQVKMWLQSCGFTVEGVAKSGRIVTFSGTSGQVEAAFHTEMHSFAVSGEAMNGEERISNTKDISIPEALSPVVVGVSSLNNFRPTHSLHSLKVAVDPGGQVVSATSRQAAPNTTLPGAGAFPTGHFVGGADLAKIYNTTPLLAAGIDGAGVTIGIIGQTDVLQSDVQIYRSLFGLPVNNFNRIQIGGDPGTIADDGESDLDLEVSGAMAPNATINFYTSGNSYFGGGIDSSLEYAVEDNSSDIISLSYGECEQNLGAASNFFYNIIYEQAAAQGQSIFVSSGDSGPDMCGVYYNPLTQTGGYGVNGFASTPYNVAVGGTQFNEGSSYNAAGPTPFWGDYGAAPPFASALGYIPEQPWNESQFGTGAIGGFEGAGSGVSFYYATPSYQVGPGVPLADPNPPSGSYEAALPVSQFVVPGPHRYLPDVSLNSAVYHDGTIFCSEGSCQRTPTGGLSTFGIVGGTSVAAPEMSGAQALINQANGGRQGVPNYYYYRLAALQSQSSCTAASYVATGGCAFHDSQAGSTNIPAVYGSATAEIGWSAGPQYDLAVGLGSPDVANLATKWASVNFNATSTAFTLTPSTSAHGAVVNVAIKVSPASGVGTPTGNVAIVAQATNGSLGFYTLTNGAVANGTVTGLPAGTYNVYARYGGDTTYGASLSAPVQVTVGMETSTVVAASFLLAANGALVPTASFTYGTNVYVNAGVAPTSGIGVATGPITFTLSETVNSSTSNPTSYRTNLDPNGTSIGSTRYSAGAYFDAGPGFAAYDIASTYPVLAPGTYTAKVSYGGDSTFGAANATPITFVVSPAATTFSVKAASATISSGANATITAAVTTVGSGFGGVAATGTVTFTDTTSSLALGTSTLTGGSATFTTQAILASGAHTVSTVYSGDANYGTASASVVITVGGAASSVTLDVSPSTAQVLTPVTLKATVPSGTTGTVYFFDGALSLGSAAISLTNYTSSLTVKSFTAGTHSLTAIYQGNATLAASSTSVATTLVVTQNTPKLNLLSQPASATNSATELQGVVVPSPSNGASAAAVPPTGAIQFLDLPGTATSATTVGTAPIVYQPGGYATYVGSLSTLVLKPGYHSLTATYAGDANYSPASSNTQSVAIGITAMTVTSSTSSVGTNIPFTLQANVLPLVPTSTAMTGTVTFFDGVPGTGAVIGTAPVAGGVASLTTATLKTAAAHSVTAVYSGDANFYTATFSTGVSIVAVTPGFGIAVTPATLTIKAGNAGSVSLTATSFGNYSGVAATTCSGLPNYAYCTITYPPNSAAQSFAFHGVNGIQAATLTITTISPNGPNTHPAAVSWLAALLLAGLLGWRRRRLSALAGRLLAVAILLCGAMSLSGCGEGSPSTPRGTYNVVVTSVGVGAATADPDIQPTTTIALTVN